MSRVLVVDDDVHLTRMLHALLSHEKYEVDVAHSGEDALTALSAQHPDLIILDVMLPGVDGVVVCKQLRDQGMDIPILMFSALTDPEVIEQARINGATFFVNKPCSLKSLTHLVRQCLNAWPAEQSRHASRSARPPSDPGEPTG